MFIFGADTFLITYVLSENILLININKVIKIRLVKSILLKKTAKYNYAYQLHLYSKYDSSTVSFNDSKLIIILRFKRFLR